MLSIIRLTVQEILSKRIFAITLFMTLAFLVLYGVANHYAAEGLIQALHGIDTGRSTIQSQISMQIVIMGLSFSSMIVALLAILSGVGAVAGEIENHQIDTVLARPLGRSSFVLGKFGGLGLLVAIYALILFIGILLINHWAGGTVAAQLQLAAMVKAGVLFALIPLSIVAVALWLSTYLSTINSGVILIVMYGVGFVGRMIEQVGSLLNNQALLNTGIISSLIFPFDALTRKVNAILLGTDGSAAMLNAMTSGGGSSEPSNAMLVYGLAYTLFFLLLAIRHFKHRDV